jgi:cytosine deaminase
LYSVRGGKVLMKRQMPVVEFFGDQG